MLRHLLIFLAAFACLDTSAFSETSGRAWYWNILAQKRRPTIEQISEYLKSESKGLPDDYLDSDDKDEIFELESVILKDVPEFIVALEIVFPNGIYAGLGRDAAMLGDTLDAFYRSQNQKRVIRINGSGDTIRPETNELLFEFLLNEGLDLGALKAGRPFVVFDRTPYEFSSQSYKILRAIYENLTPDSIDFSRSHQLVNAVSINGLHSYSLHPISGSSFVKDYWKSIRKGHRESPPEVALVYKREGLNKTLIDAVAWHDSFGRLFFSRGRLQAEIGAVEARDDRKFIVASMVTAIKATSRPGFRNLVKWSARKFGYKWEDKKGLSVREGPLDLPAIFLELVEVLRYAPRNTWNSGVALGITGELIEDFISIHAPLIPKAKKGEWLARVFGAINNARLKKRIDDYAWQILVNSQLNQIGAFADDPNIQAEVKHFAGIFERYKFMRSNWYDLTVRNLNFTPENYRFWKKGYAAISANLNMNGVELFSGERCHTAFD